MSVQYYLMNKDKPLLSFICERNEYEEPIFIEDKWLTDTRPLGFMGLSTFIESRRAPKHRAHIAELLRQYGCDDLEGFLQATHALSLNDTLWVKSADSDLLWDDVSLYKNPFSEIISRTAFDGVSIGIDFPSTSPEFGTEGAFAKCWKRVEAGQQIYLYKSGSTIYEIEPLSEYLAAQVSSILCPSYVDYDLDRYHGRLISTCKLFTDEKTGYISASRIFMRKQSISNMLDYFNALDSGDSFRRMCVLDALIFNVDRHLGNFGILIDNDTFKPLRMAPVFDHNQSLFPSVDDDHIGNLTWYASRSSPRFGTDLNVTAHALLTDSIRSDLKNLHGFEFAQHPQLKAPDQRLHYLSELVNKQIDNILDRTTVRFAAESGIFNFDRHEKGIVGYCKNYEDAQSKSTETEIEK